MRQQELDKILEQHILWLQDSTKGKRADLRNADLYHANLCGTNLSSADLRGANLRSANLHSTSLRGTDLRDADLSDADLRHADMYNSILCNANLYGATMNDAHMRSANLQNADLQYSILYGIDLRGTNLRGADLRGADLRDADLTRANLRSAKLSGSIGLEMHNICPEGTIIGWKKTLEGNILKLEIPASAKRCNKIGSRKCRASKAKVLGLYAIDGKQLQFDNPQYSKYKCQFTYSKGQLLEVADFCDDMRIECAPGIHFFVTFKEAARFDT